MEYLDIDSGENSGDWFREAARGGGEQVELFLADPAIMQKQSESI